MTKRLLSSRRSAAIAVTLSGAGFAWAVSAAGQFNPSAASTANARPPAYEVISVKASKPGCFGMSISASPGRYTARCITVWGLIFNAYDVQPAEHAPGLPGWADSAKFDIDAKMDDDTAAAMQRLSRAEAGNQRQRMLRALLADRFGLLVHTESRIEPIYELVIAKGGSKLRPWPADTPTRARSWGPSFVRIEGGPIERLAFCLMSTVGRTVMDKTGLTGDYDIDLKWTPDDQQGTPNAGPTLFTALDEQLGLKLVPEKGPVQTFIIDHVERPTEN